MKEQAEIPILQPLLGLSEDAVNEAFKNYKVSEEFEKAVISKAAIEN